MCDRPTQINLNEKHQFQSEAAPALQYSDGFSLYAHKGTFIPEKYGSVPVEEWQIQWVLEEENALWQNALMHEFGAVHVYQELPTVEIETFQNYR